MKAILLLAVSLLVAGNWAFAEEEPDLDDPKVRDKILKEAVLLESLEPRGQDEEILFYLAGKQSPYTGWAKMCFDNGQVRVLGHYKDGKANGQWPEWHDKGQKAMEGRYKDGNEIGLWTEWNEDGEVVKQTRFKDGVEVKE